MKASPPGMRVLLAVALALGSLPLSSAKAAQTVALGAPDNWKYLAFDPATKQVFVAHGTEVTVVDAATLRIVGHIQGLSGAHGVTIVPGGNGYVASSKTATVTVFNPKTLRVVGVLKAGEDANSVTYDPASARVFVANDDAGTVTVIDAATRKPVGSIALPGGEGLESAVPDGSGHLYMNHSAANEVIRIDTRNAEVDAAWKLPGCTKPQGIALDDKAQRLFISCENGGLLILNQQDGRLIAKLPIGPASDTVLFDRQRHRIYTANADGTMSVIRQDGADGYTTEAPIVTAKGAHTAALDPATGTVFLVTADIDAKPSATNIRPHQSYRFQPNTVKLLIVDPTRPVDPTQP